MTGDFGLWEWFEAVQRTDGHGLRATAEIAIQSADAVVENRTDLIVFTLTGCLPVKLKAPGLNAKDGLVAVEEMQVAYETLTRRTAEGAPA